jgi:hypothetical protein
MEQLVAAMTGLSARRRYEPPVTAGTSTPATAVVEDAPSDGCKGLARLQALQIVLLLAVTVGHLHRTRARHRSSPRSTSAASCRTRRSTRTRRRHDVRHHHGGIDLSIGSVWCSAVSSPPRHGVAGR